MNRVFKYILIFFSFLLTAYVCAFILKDSVYCADDLAFNFLEAPLNISRKLCYGAWVMKFQYVLMYILPQKFDIDFQTWGLTFGVIFKSFVLLFFPLFAFCFYLSKKLSGFLSLSLSLISFFLLFSLYSKTQYVDFIIYTGFFRFIIPALLLFIALYFMYELYFGKKVNSAFMFLLAYLCAFSSEVTAGILLPFACLLLFFRIIRRELEDYKNISLLPLSSFLFGLFGGTFKLLSTEGFREHFIPKLGEMHISFPLILQNLPDFLGVMAVSMFKDYYYIWLLIIVLIIYNIRHQQKKNNIFALSILFGVFVFAFSLIIMGKTNYEGDFWLVHNDIHAVFIPCFIFALMVLSSELIVKTQNKPLFKPVLCFVFLLSFLLFSFFGYRLHQRLSVIKDYTYLRDKMVLFYSYKGQRPILPISAFIYNIYFPELPPFGSEHCDEATASELLNSDKFSVGVLMMKLYYYPMSYGLNVFGEYDEPQFLNHNLALELFKFNGGSYDEILNKSYKFSDLSDVKFIMNNNIRLLK